MMTDQNSTIRSLLRSGQVLEIAAQTHVRHKISSSSRGAGPRLIVAFAARYPIWVVLLARFKGRGRHLGWRAVVGLIVGFAGVAILIAPDGLHSNSQVSLLGAAAVLFGAFMWGLGTIYAQDAKLPSSSMLSAAMQMATGGISLCCAGLLTGEATRLHLATVTAKSALSLAYLIVFGSIIAFTAFTWLNTASSPTRVSTF